MSAPRYRIPAKVIALLHEREMTCAKLARLSCLSERHVGRVLAAHPLANERARAKLIPWLTWMETSALGWSRKTAPEFHAEHDNSPSTKNQTETTPQT